MTVSPPGTSAVEAVNKRSFWCTRVPVEWDYVAHLVARWSSDTTLPNWEKPCKLDYTVSTLSPALSIKGKRGFLVTDNSSALAMEMKTSAICTQNCEVTGEGTKVMLLACAGLFGNSKCMLCFECL